MDSITIRGRGRRVAKLGEGKACPERSRRGSASQEARIRTKMDAPSIRVLCEWAGKHDTPARTGGSRGLQASEKSAATPRPSGPNSTTLTCFCNRARLQSCRTLLLPRSVILNGARLGPRARVSARGVSEVKDLLLSPASSALHHAVSVRRVVHSPPCVSGSISPTSWPAEAAPCM